MSMDNPTARRLARELIGAAVAGDVPETTLMELAAGDDGDGIAVVQALVHHARALVRMLATLLDVEDSEVIDNMAAMDWLQEDETPGHSG
jgi:hypothetical protein